MPLIIQTIGFGLRLRRHQIIPAGTTTRFGDCKKVTRAGVPISRIFKNEDFGYPFQTMAQAIAAVPAGGDILIRTSGSSHETMNNSKPMNIIAHGGIATIGH